jgi:hypothetical protein
MLRSFFSSRCFLSVSPKNIVAPNVLPSSLCGDRKNIVAADVLSLSDYNSVRSSIIRRRHDIKKARRLPVCHRVDFPLIVQIGPHATAFFESYDTIWFQIHEMIRIEKLKNADDIALEMEAYNDLIPKGRNICCALSCRPHTRSHDAYVRHGRSQQTPRAPAPHWSSFRFQAKLTVGVHQNITLTFGGDCVAATPFKEEKQPPVDGRAPAVYFLNFSLTPAQV